MKKDKDELNELLHWLAINYPGIYRMWTNEKNNQKWLNENLKEVNKQFK